MEQVVLNLLNIFGTGKDVDTGKAYVTFLGQESKKTVADIKTAFTELEQIGKYSGNGASVNDKGGLLGAFLLGNANTDYNISGSLKADCNALTEYFRLIKSEGYDAKDALDLVKNTVPDVTESFEKFAKGIDVSGKSLTECITEFIPSFIKQVTHATTVTKILGNVIVGLGSALKSMAVTAGVTLAIMALGKAIGFASDQFKSFVRNASIKVTGYDYFESYAKAAEKLGESANATKQATSELDGYKDKINELRESLDSGTLSESEAYDARKELISIQDTLVEKYNMEGSAIDLVNGKLDEQIAKINAVSDAKANQFLDDPDNKRAYKEAQMYMGADTHYTTQAYKLSANDDELARLQEIASKYGLDIRTLSGGYKAGTSFTIDITADPTKAEEAYSGFVQEVSSDTKISDSLKSDIDTYTQEARESASTIISNYQEESDAARDFQIQTTSAYKELNDQLIDAQESYEDAIASGDDTRIDAALKKVKQVQNSINRMSFNQPGLDGSANKVIEDYFQEQSYQLSESTKLQATQKGLTEAFNVYSNYVNEATDAVNGLSKAEEKYGNIDNENRNLISWTTDNLEKYGSTLDTWADKFGDLKNNLNGKWSTVLGNVDTTKNWMGVKDDLSFAYTMFFQDGNSLVPLTQQNFRSYIAKIINHATDSKTGKIDANKMLKLDATGFDMEIDGEMKHVQGLLGAVQGAFEDGVVTSLGDVHAIAGATEEDLEKMGLSSQYAGRGMHQLHEQTRLAAAVLDDPDSFGIIEALQNYLDIDNESAKKLFQSLATGLDELDGLDDVDILNIGSLEKAQTESEKYSKTQIDGYNKIAEAAEIADISVGDFVDMLVKANLVYSDNIKYTNEFTSSALTMAAATTKAVSSVTSILNSQGTGTNVDSDSYSELIKDNAEYAAALQYTNGTMQLNREMTQKLTDAKVKESEAIIKVAYSQNQYKYQEVRSDLSKYTDEVRKSIETDADRLKQFDEEKAALESQSEALRDNCRSLQMQYSALMQASSAYQDWLNAQNATESGDMYDSAIEAKKALAEGLKNGKIGTVKW